MHHFVHLVSKSFFSAVDKYVDYWRAQKYLPQSLVTGSQWHGLRGNAYRVVLSLTQIVEYHYTINQCQERTLTVWRLAKIIKCQQLGIEVNTSAYCILVLESPKKTGSSSRWNTAFLHRGGTGQGQLQ